MKSRGWHLKVEAAQGGGGLADGAAVEEFGEVQEVQVHSLVHRLLGAQEGIPRGPPHHRQQPQRRARLRPAVLPLRLSRRRLQHNKYTVVSARKLLHPLRARLSHRPVGNLVINVAIVI